MAAFLRLKRPKRGEFGGRIRSQQRPCCLTVVCHNTVMSLFLSCNNLLDSHIFDFRSLWAVHKQVLRRFILNSTPASGGIKVPYFEVRGETISWANACQFGISAAGRHRRKHRGGRRQKPAGQRRPRCQVCQASLT